MTVTVTDITVQIILTYLGLAWYLYAKGQKDDCWKMSLYLTSAFAVGVFITFFGIGGFIIALVGNVVLAAFMIDAFFDIAEAAMFIAVLILCEAVLFGFIHVLL